MYIFPALCVGGGYFILLYSMRVFPKLPALDTVVGLGT